MKSRERGRERESRSGAHTQRRRSASLRVLFCVLCTRTGRVCRAASREKERKLRRDALAAKKKKVAHLKVLLALYTRVLTRGPE